MNQTYKFHYTGHLPIGPSCCVADVTPNGARVFTNTQDAYGTRQNIKDVLDVVMGAKAPALNRIRLTYVEGVERLRLGAVPRQQPGGGDHVGARRQAGAPPVHALGRARLGQLRPGPDDRHPRGRDAEGNITAFEFTHFGIPYCTTQPAQQQVVAGKTVFPSLATQYAAQGRAETTISGSQYNIPNWSVIGKSLPLQNNYFKVTFLRAPDNPQSAFAAEQAVDELAYMAKMDPVAFRLQNVATTET